MTLLNMIFYKSYLQDLQATAIINLIKTTKQQVKIYRLKKQNNYNSEKTHNKNYKWKYKRIVKDNKIIVKRTLTVVKLRNIIFKNQDVQLSEQALHSSCG